MTYTNFGSYAPIQTGFNAQFALSGGFAPPAAPGLVTNQQLSLQMAVALIGQVLQALVQLQQSWQGMLGAPSTQPQQPAPISPLEQTQQLLQQLLRALLQNQSSQDPQPGQAQEPAPMPPAMPMEPAAADPAPAPAPRLRQTDNAGLQRYIDAVNNNGNVDQDVITANGRIPVGQARASIVEGYAAEFYAGERLENVNEMSRNLDALYADLNSGDPNRVDAATFALVASRYKNAGGDYANGQLDAVLKATGNRDLADGEGVGAKDVQTLGAVTAAIRRGTLSLDQIWGADGKDVLGGTSVKNPAKYDRAIDAVSKGDLSSPIKVDSSSAAGNSGGAGNSGRAAGPPSGGSARMGGGAWRQAQKEVAKA